MSIKSILRFLANTVHRLKAIAVLFLGLLICTSAWADGDHDSRPGLVAGSLWHAIFSQIDSQDTQLIDCSSPMTGVGHTIYERFVGVCDDQSDRPCNGRLVSYSERCPADDKFYFIMPGDDPFNFIVSYQKSEIRWCFVEPGFPHPGAVECHPEYEVARGEYRGQEPLPLIDNEEEEGQGPPFDLSGFSNGTTTVTHSKRFRLDGSRVRIPRGPQFNHGTYRCPETSENCAGAGVTVAIGKLGHSHD